MNIIQTPNEVLSNKTKDIEIVDRKVKDLINRMFEVLATQDGVGLAAPQINEPYNIAILYFEPTEKQIEEDPEITRIPRTVMINPKITYFSKELAIEKEGCLSVAKTEVLVPRAKKIHVEFIDENSNKHKIKAKGYLARVIQHEIDHLNGKTIRDYL